MTRGLLEVSHQTTERRENYKIRFRPGHTHPLVGLLVPEGQVWVLFYRDFRALTYAYYMLNQGVTHTYLILNPSLKTILMTIPTMMSSS